MKSRTEFLMLVGSILCVVCLIGFTVENNQDRVQVEMVPPVPKDRLVQIGRLIGTDFTSGGHGSPYVVVFKDTTTGEEYMVVENSAGGMAVQKLSTPQECQVCKEIESKLRKNEFSRYGVIPEPTRQLFTIPETRNESN